MRAAALLAVLVLAPALAAPHAQDVHYEDASEGLPHERPGSADDAGWTGVRFADVNGDGWMDLGAIGRKGNGSRVFLGHGDGTWTLSVNGIAPHFSGRSDLRFGDVDGDGKLDIVESMRKVWLGNGDGTWRAGPQDVPFEGEDVALGDVDNDGDLDAAVVGHLGGGIRAFLNDGRARWTERSAGLPTQNGGHKLDLADVNLDGCLDVVAAYWYDGGAWLGDCSGNWTDRSEGLRDFQGWDVAAGDVNTDGLPDLVYTVFATQSGPRGIRVFLGDGTGNWTALPVLFGDESWGGLALEDVDGDGNLDILAGNTCFGSCTARVALLLGDGAGGFVEADAGLPSGVDELEGLSAADIDHNGVFDAGLAHYGPDGVRVWREASHPSVLSVRVLEPRGGEQWVSDGAREIRWDTAIPAGLAPGSVALDYSTSGPSGPWRAIASGLPDSGSYLWRVPPAQSANAFVRVTAQAGEGTAAARNPDPFGIDSRALSLPRIAVLARAQPGQVAPLEPVALHAEVRDQGFVRVTGTLRLTVTRAGLQVFDDAIPVDIADGATAALDGSWTSSLANRPGSYAVRARFDGTGFTPDGSVELSRTSATAFTLRRPWLDATLALPPGASVGDAFALRVNWTNTGNLPAENVTWEVALPAAYAFAPNASRLGPAALLHAPGAQASDPAPAEAHFELKASAWVLRFDVPSLAPGARVSVRADLVALGPGAHPFAADATYGGTFPSGMMEFHGSGQAVQRVVLDP